MLPKLPGQIMNFKGRSNAFRTIGTIVQNGNTNPVKITPTYSNNNVTVTVSEITNKSSSIAGGDGTVNDQQNVNGQQNVNDQQTTSDTSTK